VARIGIVTDGPWKRFPETIDLFKQEILRMTALEFDVQFPPDKAIHGNWTVSGINQAINRLLKDPDVDMVIALGPVATNEACKRRHLQKSVIAPFVIDSEIQRLPVKDGTSGVKNLSYINAFRSMDLTIKAFRELVPFNRLTVLGDSFTLQAIPELQGLIAQIEEKHGIELEIVGVETSAAQALEDLPPDTQEAVLVTNLLRITPDDFQKLVAGLIERRLPSFSWWGRDEVDLGILASIAPESTLEYLARSVAVNVQDILRGENAGTLSVAFALGEQLTINMASARAIDVYPSLSMLTEADLLNEERKDIQRVLTLEKAVREALAANLDLAAADRNVAAGAQEVLQARSQLLPQVGISSGGTIIDEDRARVSGGMLPERAWTGSAAATQLIYSDKAWSDHTVQKRLQNSRLDEREAVRLDIIQAAATAYLNVLKAKTNERIQKDNLTLTRANLERANVRVSVGIAGPDEIYRWESEIAQRRQVVLAAESLTLDAMNALNRILHRPMQEPFVVEGTELGDPLFALSDKLFVNLVNNPKNLQVFQAFMVQEGLELAPELRRFDAEIAARERTLVSAKREFWLPAFSLQGNVTELFAENGSGTRDKSLADLDSTEWAVGVFATLPLYTGGGKSATKRRTLEELAQLRIECNATAERIEQRILNAINLTRASYPSIQLSRDASDAADRNLKLVTDSYARGIKSIIDLLDAQNLALEADQRAANAVHNFLIDLMNVQRAIGRFDFSLTPEEREAWFQRLDEYFQKADEASRNE
jgi:outer membrane protein TolC